MPCSRESDSAATSDMIQGAEGRSNDPGEHCIGHIRNPDDRIPVSLPGQQTKEDAFAIPGNSDIRVSEEMEIKDGLRARGASEKEDAKEKRTGRGGDLEKRPDHEPEEERTETHSEDNPKGRDGPEEPERRHVPGGTWLSQVRSYLKDNFRLMRGREETVGGVEGEGEGGGKGDKKTGGKDLKSGT
ncbi:hypothetical protein NDU88_004255 [Pleurodeles waltl]|uniref:Uncharacterized protein n=1 Tax=Pleurodeles waltl TaxID=8319 RepID=A0AAV7SIA7_PLEWA|nr:hypothetical protein NDU88_004255 [Pleurodeles waltl]